MSDYPMISTASGDRPMTPAEKLAFEQKQAAGSMDALKTEKEREIRAEYETATQAPVPVGDLTFNGGSESALLLDAAVRKAEHKNTGMVVFFDVENQPQELVLSDARTVVVAVGDAFEAALGRKQARLSALSSAGSVEAVGLV